jgi:hypothetical protein
MVIMWHQGEKIDKLNYGLIEKNSFIYLFNYVLVSIIYLCFYILNFETK